MSGPLGHQHGAQTPVLGEAQQCEAISNPASLHRVNMDKRIAVTIPGTKNDPQPQIPTVVQGRDSLWRAARCAAQ